MVIIIAWLAPPSVYEWVNVRQYCEALWIKAQYKCNSFTIIVGYFCFTLLILSYLILS